MVKYYVDLSRNIYQNGECREQNAGFRHEFEAKDLEEAHAKIRELEKYHTPEKLEGMDCWFNIRRLKRVDSQLDIIGPRS